MGALVIDRSTERASGVIGLIGVVIALAGLPLAPKWPEANAPIDVVRAYFVEHGGAFLTQNCVVWFGFVLFAGFFVGASLRIARTGRHALSVASLLGATLLLGAMIFGNAPWAALAFAKPESADVVRGLWNLGLVSAFNVAGIAMFAALAPLGTGIVASSTFPRWFGVFVLGGAALGLGLALCFAPSGTSSPSGSVGVASIVVLSAIIAIGSVLLIRGAPSP